MQDPAELDVICHFNRVTLSLSLRYISRQSDSVVLHLWFIMFVNSGNSCSGLWTGHLTPSMSMKSSDIWAKSLCEWFSWLWLILCWYLSWWVVILDVVLVLWLWLTHNACVYIDGILMNVQGISADLLDFSNCVFLVLETNCLGSLLEYVTLLFTRIVVYVQCYNIEQFRDPVAKSHMFGIHLQAPSHDIQTNSSRTR